MKNVALMLSLLCGCLLPCQAAAPRLPGTKPVVEASEYSSLQAAIDAVPYSAPQKLDRWFRR